MYRLYCFQCESFFEYSEEKLEEYKKILDESGGVWWKCPNCNSRIYFNEVYSRAKRGALK